MVTFSGNFNCVVLFDSCHLLLGEYMHCNYEEYTNRLIHCWLHFHQDGVWGLPGCVVSLGTTIVVLLVESGWVGFVVGLV